MTTDITRNATFEDLVEILRDQQGRRIDLLRDGSNIQFRDGRLIVSGADPIIEDDGVTDPNGEYIPTAVFDEGVADKLKIPLAYVRRLRAERPDLYDANINGLFRGGRARIDLRKGVGDPSRILREATPADPRTFMLRTFRGNTGEPGVARALLSNRYGVIDNLDVVTAALQGIQQADARVKITGCDLSERRMYVRVQSLDVQALAPALLAGYRSPYSGREGADNPVVWAGFVITNSEVGNGKAKITPRIVFEVCDNGMTITKDAEGAVHVGSRQEESIVRYSEETTRKELEVVTLKTRDAVRTFLSPEYLEALVEETTEKGARTVEPTTVVQTVAKKLSFSDEVREGILDCFMRSGQMTAGGVMQAVTAYAQQVEDADLASSLEDSAVQVLELAAAL